MVGSPAPFWLKELKIHLTMQIAINAAEELTQVGKSWAQHKSIIRERICVLGLPCTAVVKEASQLSAIICWLSHHRQCQRKEGIFSLLSDKIMQILAIRTQGIARSVSSGKILRWVGEINRDSSFLSEIRGKPTRNILCSAGILLCLGVRSFLRPEI